jgi:hypothetical protein
MQEGAGSSPVFSNWGFSRVLMINYQDKNGINSAVGLRKIFQFKMFTTRLGNTRKIQKLYVNRILKPIY